MTPNQATALKSELSSDPAGIGYAQMTPAAQVVALNDPNGKGAASVAKVYVTTSQLVGLFSLMALNLAGLNSGNPSAAIQAKWDRIINIWKAAPVNLTLDPSWTTVFTAAVADGLLTSGQATAAANKTSPRIQVLFGDGAVATILDGYVQVVGV